MQFCSNILLLYVGSRPIESEVSLLLFLRRWMSCVLLIFSATCGWLSHGLFKSNAHGNKHESYCANTLILGTGMLA